MSTISTKSPCYANRAGDEADVETRGPDPGPGPIVPGRNRGKIQPKHPLGAHKVPGSAFAALLRESHTIPEHLQPDARGTIAPARPKGTPA